MDDLVLLLELDFVCFAAFDDGVAVVIFPLEDFGLGTRTLEYGMQLLSWFTIIQAFVYPFDLLRVLVIHDLEFIIILSQICFLAQFMHVWVSARQQSMQQSFLV